MGYPIVITCRHHLRPYHGEFVPWAPVPGFQRMPPPGHAAGLALLPDSLIRSLRSCRSIIVPLLFTPMETTRLEYASPLLKKNLTPQHYELITACWDHNLDWFPPIWAGYGRHGNIALRTAMNLLMKLGAGPVRSRIHRNAKKHGAAVS